MLFSIIFVLALVVGCFAAMPLPTNAAVATVVDFDVDAEYWISDTWVSYGGYVTVNTLFADGTFWGDQKDIRNADGEIVTRPANVIYDFEVRTSLGDDYVSYASFCANYGSTAFGGLYTSYVVGVMDSELKADILAAFNYIYDTYGSLDGWQEAVRFEDCSRPVTVEGSTRVLSQIVVWMLIDNGIADMYATVGCGGWDYGNYFDSGVNEAVADVLDAVEGGYTGAGVVKDLVLLVGPNYPADEISVQPQIVPLLDVTPPPDPQIIIKKTVDGVAFRVWLSGYTEEEQVEILQGINFELYEAEGKNGRIASVPVAVSAVNDLGVIDFTPWFKANNGLSGWYAVVEKLSGKAAEIFVDPVSLLYIQIGANGVVDSDFDSNDEYSCSTTGIAVLARKYLTDDPDVYGTPDTIYNFYVSGVVSGREYLSL